MRKGGNRGLSKRCGHGRRQWSTCLCAWHFDFYKDRKFRFSCDVLAKARGEKPPRTKGEAEDLAHRVRREICAGTFRDPKGPAPAPTPDATVGMTVGDVIDQYLTRHVHLPHRRPGGAAAMVWALGILRRTEIPAAGGGRVRFEQKAIAAVTKGDVEAVRAARWAVARPGCKGSGINRLLSRLRHVLAWAVAEGYAESTPWLRGGVVVVKLTKETGRDRRLQEGEAEALLAQAPPHLRDVIVAALATGMRVGEVLSLQFRDIRTTTDARGQTRQVLVLDPAKTKANERRIVPVDQRLAAVLAMRRHAPDGTALDGEAYCFGDPTGRRIKSVQAAWITTVLRAHGHLPTWTPGANYRLTPESRAAYRKIDLHLHDLRHEFGSVLLESGSSLAEARDLLGHSNITQTSTYLQSTAKSLGAAIDRKEAYERDLAAARQRQAEASAAETFDDEPAIAQLDRIQ